MSIVDPKDEAALVWLEAVVPDFRRAFTMSAKFRATIVNLIPLWRMQVELMALGADKDIRASDAAARYAERVTRSIVLTGEDAQMIRDMFDRPHTKGVTADSEEGMRRGE